MLLRCSIDYHVFQRASRICSEDNSKESRQLLHFLSSFKFSVAVKNTHAKVKLPIASASRSLET
jgi:hypothetical protein